MTHQIHSGQNGTQVLTSEAHLSEFFSLCVWFITRLLLLLSHFSCVRLCVPHRRQPTRLPHPWDSPGKNTGVGCHFLLHITRHLSSFCSMHRRGVLLAFPNSFNPLWWEGELGRRINCKIYLYPAYTHSLRLFLPCLSLSTHKKLHGGFASTCLHQLQKGACKESCHAHLCR